jgi:hypothetical protein
MIHNNKTQEDTKIKKNTINTEFILRFQPGNSTKPLFMNPIVFLC